MNLSSLQTEIARKIADVQNDRWSLSVLTERINLIQKDIVVRTKCLRDVGLDSIVAGTPEYALPTGYLDMLRVLVNGKEVKGVTKDELDMEAGTDWTLRNGTPTRHYIDVDPDNQKIGLVPNPQSGDAGSSNLKMYYVRAPVDLSGSTDIPFNIGTATASNLLEAHSMTIVYGAAAMCLEDNIADPGNKSKRDEFLIEYEKGLAKLNDLFDNPSDEQMAMRGGRNWGQTGGQALWTE